MSDDDADQKVLPKPDAMLALHDVTYQDVFTGMVFYRPLGEHRLGTGIPGLADEAFVKELERRLIVSGRTIPPDEFKGFIESLNRVSSRPYGELAEFAATIRKWRAPAKRDG